MSNIDEPIKVKMYCQVIKGNNKMCSNYARKNMECCYSHRKLETGYTEEIKKTKVLPIAGICCKCENKSTTVVVGNKKTYYCRGCFYR